MSPEDLVTLIAQEFADASLEDDGLTASHFSGNAQFVLAALVDALGFARSNPHALRMVADQLVDDGFHKDGALVTEIRGLADAIALILQAANVTSD